MTLLPETIIPILEAQLLLVKGMHEKDLAEGFGAVYPGRYAGITFTKQ